MKNPKNKGGSFERLICKQLSLWWTNNEDDSLFWRTSTSGGRHTQRKKQNKNTYNQEGDICATHPDTYKFSEYISIECKHYKSIDFFATINNKGLLIEWWSKLNNICKDVSKIPILIVKVNNKPILMITNKYLCDLISTNFKNIFISSFKWDELNNEWFYICKFEDFLKFDRNIFMSSLNNYTIGTNILC